MRVVPLDVPLRTLRDDRRVFVVAKGIVFTYPAAVLADIANDRYIVHDYWSLDPITTSMSDVMQGLAAERAFLASSHSTPAGLCAAVWGSNGGMPDLFTSWWASVSLAGPIGYVAAACAYAARNTMTWSAFVHRYEVDTSGQSL